MRGNSKCRNIGVRKHRENIGTSWDAKTRGNENPTCTGTRVVGGACWCLYARALTPPRKLAVPAPFRHQEHRADHSSSHCSRSRTIGAETTARFGRHGTHSALYAKQEQWPVNLSTFTGPWRLRSGLRAPSHNVVRVKVDARECFPGSCASPTRYVAVQDTSLSALVPARSLTKQQPNRESVDMLKPALGCVSLTQRNAPG